MDPYIGKMLENRYEILERIGTGGMAVVYKAKDNRLNRLVAVKILKSDLAQDADFRRHFNAESQAVAQLSSPHIVSVYDVSKGGDTEYIVMELIDGITLKQYMEKRGQLNWRESLHFITQIMRGLAHAHSKGIVHRDIKPQNIMVLRDGSVKVADFGIACLENSSQTLTQQALGSVHYISPEQAKGDRTDSRSDIYSAGVVLYEMLTSRLPFEGESAVSVALQHLSSIPLAPRAINPEIPEQLELICMKAMAPDLKKRYASAEDMIYDLEAFRKDPSVNLDFQLEDLRPDEVTDEPTRPIPSTGVAAVHRERVREEDEYVPAGHSTFQIILFIIAGILALALAFVTLRSILGSFDEAEETPEVYVVKNVVGYTVDQARQLDGIQGIFDVVEAGKVPSDTQSPGTIVRQDPEANSYRKGENRVISVWVSSGEDTAVMPSVVNQSVSQAEKITLKNLIQDYQLTIEAPEDEMQYHDVIPSGNIISSIPGEGDTIHKGDTIHLIVSKGAQTWPLTRFIGMSIEQVTSQLSGLKLGNGGVTYEFSEEPEGTVIAQKPDPMTAVKDGTSVSFVVSKGPEKKEEEAPQVPEVTEPAAPTETPPEVITKPAESSEPPAPETVTKEVVIPLPTDRENGYLEVYQDGERVFTRTVDCTPGTYALDVTGTGEVFIAVYLDQEEIFSDFVSLGAQ